MYRALQLGFVGQYRAQDDERREDIVRARRAGARLHIGTGCPHCGPRIAFAQRPSLVLAELGCGRCRHGSALVFLSSSLTGLVSQIVRPG